MAKTEYTYSSVGIQRDRINEHGRREQIEPMPYIRVTSGAGRMVQINMSEQTLIKLVADAALQLARLRGVPRG